MREVSGSSTVPITAQHSAREHGAHEEMPLPERSSPGRRARVWMNAL